MDNRMMVCNPEPKKILQVPVIKGFGERQELVVKELTIAPPNPPVFRIINVDKEVVITNYKLITACDAEDAQGFWKAKVILDGFIDKNITYKTISDFTEDAVGGPVFHFTTRFDFATFVEVKAREAIFKTDKVEILSAVVEGENEELLNPNPVPCDAPDFAVTYNSLLEKMIVKIRLKVIRVEDVVVK